MDQRPTPREHASAHLLRQYQDAGRPFDGIHQMLLTHLRENRQAEPDVAAGGPLAADISRLGFADYQRPASAWPNFVIDGSVLLSYARLDNEAVGAALIDAVHDTACQTIVSPLAYLKVAPALVGTTGEQRVHRLMRHFAEGAGPTDRRVLDVPDLTFRQVEIIARLDTGEPLDVMHTALLALRHRCVIGTLNPVAYHRLGYLRTLNLSA